MAIALKNTLLAAITVHGVQQYDILPGHSVPVDSDTDWTKHPYVVCGALVLEGVESAEDEDGSGGNGSEGNLDPNDPPGDDIEDLREEAKALGIEIDGRWGEKRLRAEIDQALKA